MFNYINVIYAFVGALVNIILVLTVPILLEKTDSPFLNEIKSLYKQKKDLIISSSIIMGITIFLTLELLSNNFNITINDSSTSNFFSNLNLR